jgi:hypothetical protein
MDHSLQGFQYDGIIFVRDFFPGRKPSFMYEGIVLGIGERVNILF